MTARTFRVSHGAKGFTVELIEYSKFWQFAEDASEGFEAHVCHHLACNSWPFSWVMQQNTKRMRHIQSFPISRETADLLSAPGTWSYADEDDDDDESTEDFVARMNQSVVDWDATPWYSKVWCNTKFWFKYWEYEKEAREERKAQAAK